MQICPQTQVIEFNNNQTLRCCRRNPWQVDRVGELVVVGGGATYRHWRLVTGWDSSPLCTSLLWLVALARCFGSLLWLVALDCGGSVLFMWRRVKSIRQNDALPDRPSGPTHTCQALRHHQIYLWFLIFLPLPSIRFWNVIRQFTCHWRRFEKTSIINQAWIIRTGEFSHKLITQHFPDGTIFRQ